MKYCDASHFRSDFILKYVRVRGTGGVVTSSLSQDGVKETTPSCATTCDFYVNARLIALSIK